MAVRGNSKGFTIIEIIMTVVVITIASSIVIPSWTHLLNSIRLRSSTDTLKKKLIGAKTRAMADPYVHCGVYFDLAQNESLVFLDYNGNNRYDAGTDEIYQAATPLAVGVVFELPASQAIQDNVVVFRGDGSAKFGGNIILRQQTSGNRSKTVSITKNTGRIRVL